MLQITGDSGGGQLLRSSLTLSILTGQPFRMSQIRGARPKPGLMRQHLTCVQAAGAVSGAAMDGAEIGSTELSFTPGKIRGGDYQFAIGSGGSTTLVLQTILPALLQASEPSTVTITGGTHNPMAPPAEFLQECYLPVLRDMGAKVELHVERPGFMAAGGGILRAEISPMKKWKPLKLTERGKLVRCSGAILHAHLPDSIAERTRRSAASALDWKSDKISIQHTPSSLGPGGIILLRAEYENITELTSAVAEMGRNAESVGASAAKQMNNYLGTTGAVGVHLADQLLLPLALAGKGTFSTFGLSKHFQTHCSLIPQFLPVTFIITEGAAGERTVSLPG
jgi:RNA 3'-terminal phosphate cyclase (ATP)